MNLYAWAIRWGIPAEAIDELKHDFGVTHDVPSSSLSEAGVTERTLLRASQLGIRLTRNNVGAYPDSTGRWIRYGLWNESKAMNKRYKSPDLVGIRPHLVTQKDVGTTLGIFVGWEMKHGQWVYSDNDHERAQLNCLELISSLGGDGRFIKSEDQVT